MATMADDRVFVDTNVLVHAKLSDAPLHRKAASILREVVNSGATLFISRQVVREYLAVMTRRDLITSPIDIDALTGDIRDFERWATVVEDGPQVERHLLSLLRRFPCGGKQIHDANIVATMLSSKVRRLLTGNVTDFRRFESVVDIMPL